jgi:hypothetical protein
MFTITSIFIYGSRSGTLKLQIGIRQKFWILADPDLDPQNCAREIVDAEDVQI